MCGYTLFVLGRLAQLVRAPALHVGCRGFESSIAHQEKHPAIWRGIFLGAICIHYDFTQTTISDEGRYGSRVTRISMG